MKRGALPRLPRRVAEAPSLDPHLELYWRAYADLSTCRPASMGGLSPIPWTACAEWARVWGLSQEQFATLVTACRKMDEVLAKWHRRKHGNQ